MNIIKLSERSKKNKEQKMNKERVLVAESAYNSQKKYFYLAMTKVSAEPMNQFLPLSIPCSHVVLCRVIKRTNKLGKNSGQTKELFRIISFLA